MLLVDDRKAEVAQDDVILDEGMGSDDERVVARREPREDLPARCCRGAAHEQSRRQAMGRQQLIEGGVVLAREDLGRCHDRGLHAGVVRHQRCQRGDDGFPAPTSPWSRRFIGPGAARSVRISCAGNPLTVGELERQRCGKPARDLDVIGDDNAGAAQAAAARALSGDLQQEHLLERDALARPVRVLDAVRDVHLVQRFVDGHEVFRLAHRGRDAVRHLRRRDRAAARSCRAESAS